ncbi:hypothetical protein BH09VER1_BH09VER1_06450 [soil metagenome]
MNMRFAFGCTIGKFFTNLSALALIIGGVSSGRAADPVNIDLSNNTGMSGSQIWVQFLGGGAVAGTYTDLNGVTQQLQANTSYSLDQLVNSAGQSMLAVDDFSGRVYISYGAYGLQGLSNTQYTPAAATPTDPNYGTRYQYFEPTIIANSGGAGGRTFYGDLSYIDFTAISLSMALTGSNGQPIKTVSNSNQQSAAGQALINQALASSQIPSQAALPKGSASTAQGSGFSRVISPQYTVDSGSGAVYASFQPYLDYLDGKTVTIAGTFVGTGPQPSGSSNTLAQAYYYTGSFTGSGTSGTLTLTSNVAVNGKTDYAWLPADVQGKEGINQYGQSTITISYADLVAATGIYGNNPTMYTIVNNSGTFTGTNGITNDVYGRVIGDVLAGLSLGYVGSEKDATNLLTATTVSGSTGAAIGTFDPNNTAFGAMASSLWWASGQAQTGTTYIPNADGTTGVAVTWGSTPASQNYIFGDAFVGTGTFTNAQFYNQYAAALALNTSGTGYGTNPYTTGYGFPLQDRLGNNLLSYSTSDYPDAILLIGINADGSSALPTGIWTGTTSGLWTDAANWSGSMVPTNSGTTWASAQFVGSATSAIAVDTGSNQSVSGIYFNYHSGTFTINNNTITLAGNIVNSSTATQTINSNVTLASNGSVIAAFGDLVLGGTVATTNSGSNFTMTFDGTRGTTVSGVITGSGGVAKVSSGTLNLSGSNSFSGGVNHEDGTLVIGNDSALGTGTYTVSSASATHAEIRATNGDRTLQNNVRLAGDVTVSGTDGLTFAGPVTLFTTGSTPVTPTVTNDATVNFSGAIGETVAGSGLTKAGSGLMTLSGSAANTFTGSLSVNSGTMVLAKTSGTAFGGDLIIGDGTGTAGSAVAQWGASNQAWGTKTLVVSTTMGGTATTTTQLVGANVTLNTDGKLDLQGNNDSVASLNLYGGSVVGTGTLTMLQTFTYSATTVNSGTIMTSGTAFLGGQVNFLGTGTSSATIGADLVMQGLGTFNVAKTQAPVGLTVTGLVSGSSVTKAGGGVLVMENSAIDGEIVVAQGILETSSATGANVLASGGGFGAISSGTTPQTVDVKSLTVSNTGALVLGLGATRSDTINILGTASTDAKVDDSTIFYFHDAGMVTGTNTVVYNLVTGESGAWSANPPSPSQYTFLSMDISGLVGSFSFSSGTLSFTGTRGVSGTWASSGDGSWETGASWQEGTQPAAGANILFGQSTATTVSTTQNQSIGSLTFTSTASAYTLTGNSIILSGDLTNSSTNAQTINNTIMVNGNRKVDAAVGNLNLQSITLSPSAAVPGVVTFSGSGNTVVAGSISDGAAPGGSIVMNGTGTVSLSGSNSFTGNIDFDSGVVSISSTNSLGSTSAARVFRFDGGTLQSTSAGTIKITQQQTAILGATSTFDVTTSGGELDLATAVSGTGGLTKEGAGTLGLIFVSASTPNTYSGVTTVNGGVLRVDYAKSLGDIAGGTVINSGTLWMDNSEENLAIKDESLTFGSGTNGPGVLVVQSGSSEWAGDVTLESDGIVRAAANSQINLARSFNTGTSNLVVEVGAASGVASGTVTFSGSLTGSGLITTTGTDSSGAGTVVFSGQSGTASAFTGTASVAQGTMALASNNALGLGGATVIVSGSAPAALEFTGQSTDGMQVALKEIQLSGSGVLSGAIPTGAINNNTAGKATVSGSITLNADSMIYATNGELELTGDVNLGTSNLTVKSLAAPITLSGAISGSGGISTLAIGTLQLSGSNSYTGNTTVGAGSAITVENSYALGSTSGSTTVVSGAVLQLKSSGSTGVAVGNESLSIAGTGLNNGALNNLSGTNSWAGDITAADGTTIQSTSGKLTLSGTLTTGTSSVIFAGPGEVMLSGTTDAANVIVSSGTFGSMDMSGATLVIGTGTATPSAPTAYYNAGGVNNVATVNIKALAALASDGGLSVDLSGTTSDLIVASLPGSYSGTMNFFFHNAGTSAIGGSYTLYQATAGAIVYSATSVMRSDIAGLYGHIVTGTDNTGNTRLLIFESGTGSARWDNSSGDGKWDTASNWDPSGGYVPIGGSAVAFTSTAATTVSTEADQYVGGLTFSAGSAALTITGNTVTTYGDIINESSVTQTVGSNVTLDGDMKVNATAGDLALSGTVNLANSGTSHILTVTGSHNTTISGGITGGNAGVVSLVKSGSGSLTVTGSNSYVGITDVSGGTFIVDGSLDNGASIAVEAHGALAGTGTAAGAVAVAGTLSPGHSPGNLTTGAQTWLDGGNYNWQMLDATGAAGTGTDLVTVNGQLDLSNLSTHGFSVNLWSLSGPTTSGLAENFDESLDQTWTLVATTDGIVGFNADEFLVNIGAVNGTDGFVNPITGIFSVGVSGNDLVLNYNVIPEPSTWALLGIGLIGAVAVARRRSQTARS